MLIQAGANLTESDIGKELIYGNYLKIWKTQFFNVFKLHFIFLKHQQVKMENTDIVNLFIQAGADVNHEDSDGGTAWQYCIDNG